MIKIILISGCYLGNGVFDTVEEEQLISDEALIELLSEAEWCSESDSWCFLESDIWFKVK